ncbi:hypothetical protein QR680_008234 [Steinernema hermaphroditum]|uniref:Uncharacterized protein n=1 Tax=Steinernema hermaphroditum TaxID=289476 RepID=A0AA39IIA8_9BILA|nr:hypothetical protein QR680_008234 [Steinernema hermaphroditum]
MQEVSYGESGKSLYDSQISYHGSQVFDLSRPHPRRTSNVTLESVASTAQPEEGLIRVQEKESRKVNERKADEDSVQRTPKSYDEWHAIIMRHREQSEARRKDCYDACDNAIENMKSNLHEKKRRSSHKKPIGNPDPLFLRIENHPQFVSLDEYQRMRAARKQKELRTSQYLQSHFGGTCSSYEAPPYHRSGDAFGQRESRQLTAEDMEVLRRYWRIKEEKQKRIYAMPIVNSPHSHPQAQPQSQRPSSSSRPPSAPQRVVLREQGTSPIRFEEKKASPRKVASDNVPTIFEVDARVSRLDIGTQKKKPFSYELSPIKQRKKEVEKSPLIRSRSAVRARSVSRSRPSTAVSSKVAQSGPFIPGSAGSGTSKCYQVNGLSSELLQLVRTSHPNLHGIVKEVLDSKVDKQSILQKIVDRLERRICYLKERQEANIEKFDNMDEIERERTPLKETIYDLDKEIEGTEKKLNQLRRMLPGSKAHINRIQEIRLLKVIFSA